MSSTTSANCPACKQSNSTGMAFCIFCGASMTVAAPASVPAPDHTVNMEMQAQAAGGTRKCASCGQADALNSQFCIFCGAQITNSRSTSSAHMQSELSNLRTGIASVKGSSEEKRKIQIPRALILLLLIMLGLAAGAGGSLALRSRQTEPTLSLPERGLAILTAKPFSDVFVTYPDKRHFLIGRTGAKGDLSMSDLLPGEYNVEASTPDGLRGTATAEVKQGSVGVAGGPPGEKLLSLPNEPN